VSREVWRIFVRTEQKNAKPRLYGWPAAHTANAVVSVLGADWPPASARPVQDVALPEVVTIVPAALLGKLPVRWMPCCGTLPPWSPVLTPPPSREVPPGQVAVAVRTAEDAVGPATVWATTCVAPAGKPAAQRASATVLVPVPALPPESAMALQDAGLEPEDAGAPPGPLGKVPRRWRLGDDPRARVAPPPPNRVVPGGQLAVALVTVAAWPGPDTLASTT
jgi:hypothetical protein